MKANYQNLQNGFTKDISLRNAKLEYIKNASLDRRHPYYWAGFVEIGDMSAVLLNPDSSNLYFLIGIGLLLVCILFYLYNFKFKK